MREGLPSNRESETGIEGKPGGGYEGAEEMGGREVFALVLTSRGLTYDYRQSPRRTASEVDPPPRFRRALCCLHSAREL